MENNSSRSRSSPTPIQVKQKLRKIKQRRREPRAIVEPIENIYETVIEGACPMKPKSDGAGGPGDSGGKNDDDGPTTLGNTQKQATNGLNKVILWFQKAWKYIVDHAILAVDAPDVIIQEFTRKFAQALTSANATDKMVDYVAIQVRHLITLFVVWLAIYNVYFTMYARQYGFELEKIDPAKIWQPFKYVYAAAIWPIGKLNDAVMAMHSGLNPPDTVASPEAKNKHNYMSSPKKLGVVALVVLTIPLVFIEFNYLQRLSVSFHDLSNNGNRGGQTTMAGLCILLVLAGYVAMENWEPPQGGTLVIVMWVLGKIFHLAICIMYGTPMFLIALTVYTISAIFFPIFYKANIGGFSYYNTIFSDLYNAIYIVFHAGKKDKTPNTEKPFRERMKDRLGWTIQKLYGYSFEISLFILFVISTDHYVKNYKSVVSDDSKIPHFKNVNVSGYKEEADIDGNCNAVFKDGSINIPTISGPPEKFSHHLFSWTIPINVAFIILIGIYGYMVKRPMLDKLDAENEKKLENGDFKEPLNTIFGKLFRAASSIAALSSVATGSNPAALSSVATGSNPAAAALSSVATGSNPAAALSSVATGSNPAAAALSSVATDDIKNVVSGLAPGLTPELTPGLASTVSASGGGFGKGLLQKTTL